MIFQVLLSLCLRLTSANAVTVYGQIPLGQMSIAAADPHATSPPIRNIPAYDETILNPPALPTERAPTQFTLNLQATNGTVPGLSIPQRGTFYGFSIEMSVITQLREHLAEFLVQA